MAVKKRYVKNYNHKEWDSVAGAYNSILDLEAEVVEGSYIHREFKRIESLLLKAMYESGQFNDLIKLVGCCEFEVIDLSRINESV